jgi:hypothetical protein
MKEIVRRVLNEQFNPKIIKECTIAAVRLGDEIVLAKNRDRGYRAKVEVVHEIKDGTEILYWRDVDTDWSEGLNEYGIGIINSSLWVVKDEKEGHEVKSRREKSKTKVGISNDGKIIREALSKKNLKDVINTIINFSPNNNEKKGLKGVTFVSNNEDVIVIEIDKKNNTIVKKLKNTEKVLVRTNHGVFLKNTGYLNGEKRKSSINRMKVAHKHLKDVTTDSDVLKKLKKNYEKDTFYNPYRVKNMYNMQTTGQIMLNLKKKEVTIDLDKKMGKFLGFIKELPKNYKPKIKVKIIGEKS